MTSGPSVDRKLLARIAGPHFHRRRFLNALVVGWPVVLFVAASGISNALDLKFLDIRMQLRLNYARPTVPVRVALLGPADLMDDRTFETRSIELLEQLESPDVGSSRRPSVVAFARAFTGVESAQETGARLVQATGAARPVVHGYLFTRRAEGSRDERLTGSRDDQLLRAGGLPLPPGGAALREADGVLLPSTPGWDGLLPAAAGVGYVNLAPEEGLRWTVRSVPLLMRFNGRAYPALGLAAAMAALGVKPDQVEIRMGDSVILHPPSGRPIAIPIDASGDCFLNFRPTLGSSRMVGLLASLNFAEPPSRVVSSQPPGEMLKQLETGGRLLLVGDPRQRVQTPFSTDIPLVNVHAQLASDILTGDFLERVPTGIDVVVAGLMILLFAFYVGRWDPQGVSPVSAAMAIGLAHAAFSLFVFGVWSYWMNVALVLEAMLLTVPADGFFMHYYQRNVLEKLRHELDEWERGESIHFELLAREEKEQAERLEQLQREESLARSILDRQEALVARVLPDRVGPPGTGGSPGLEPSDTVGRGMSEPATRGGDGGRSSAAGREVAGRGELRIQQPQVVRELSARYRTQAARQETLLARYRQLLDQVLKELEDLGARQTVASVATIEGAAADDLVAQTGVVTRDPVMLRLLHQIVTRIGPNDRATVLIRGESGTGKELIAKAIHRHSPRSSGPFVALNCGAFPEGLIESELFGHVRGAFSGAARDRRGAFQTAQGGVLFLDEIGDAPALIQVKLLRALQERAIRPVGADADIQVDVRIVAATHRDLRLEVRTGRFREDLFHRLHVIPIEVPPLRDREGDIPLLSRLFLDVEARAAGHPARNLSQGALARLCAYGWPGNVRELENCIVALHAIATEPVIDEALVRQSLGHAIDVGHTQHHGFSSTDLRWLDVFRRHRFSIVRAVAEPDAPARNRQTGYRRLVGLSCKALYLANWLPGDAAVLLGGDDGGPGTRKSLAKINTYLRMIEQALEGKSLTKFEADWRRFLGDDYFFVKATLDAVLAGKIRAGSGDDLGDDDG